MPFAAPPALGKTFERRPAESRLDGYERTGVFHVSPSETRTIRDLEARIAADPESSIRLGQLGQRRLRGASLRVAAGDLPPSGVIALTSIHLFEVHDAHRHGARGGNRLGGDPRASQSGTSYGVATFPEEAFGGPPREYPSTQRASPPSTPTSAGGC